MESQINDPVISGHVKNEDDFLQFLDFGKEASRDTVSFSEDEGTILDLWDQLNEFRLERAVLEAQQELPLADTPPVSSDDAEAQIKNSEREGLEARASYILSQSAVNEVLQVDPILKAVHSGVNASPAERALHPLIDCRDVTSMAHANLTTQLRKTLDTLTSTETENILAMRKNRELLSTLMELCQELKKHEPPANEDPEFQAQTSKLQRTAKLSKQRWRIMKSVVAGVVAGSGLDWARDEDLRDLVLDDED